MKHAGQRHTVMSPSGAAARRTAERTGAAAAQSLPVQPQPAMPNHALNQALQGGRPLDPAVRADMEARFGESFTDVRVQDHPAAHRSAAQMQAKAYTLGEDIVFSEGRYRPGAADGRLLLAHELAHVVQQRRGGSLEAGPQVGGRHAGHEAEAQTAAAQVAAGAPAVQVTGAAPVGVACDLEDESAAALVSTAEAPVCEDPYPLEGPDRVLQPGPHYWLDHTPDTQAMGPSRLHDEANQIEEWLNRQTSTSPDSIRLRRVLGQLREAAAARESKADAKPRPTRRKGRRGKGAPAAVPDAAPAEDIRPRTLREQSSLDVTQDPALLLAEYDDIVSYLQRDDVKPDDRMLLQLTLSQLRPLLDQELRQRSQQRHGQAVQQALAPDASEQDGRSQLVDVARRIDDIRPVAGQPGLNYILRDGEMVLMTDQQVEAIRDTMMKSLERDATGINVDNDALQREWQDFVDLNYEEHQYVGFFTMLWSRENPLYWDEKFMPDVRRSNGRVTEFRAMRKDAQDPWRGDRAPLVPMVEAISDAVEAKSAARNFYDRKVDKMISAAGDIVGVLETTKTAGQFAATIAFTPAGAALYGGIQSTAGQASEIYHGQRNGFDATAIGFDAASGYVGARVTKGVMGFTGKSAPLWQRGAVFVVADRAGAATATATRMELDNLAGRASYSAGDILGAAKDQALDWKQAAVSWGLGRAARFAHTPSSRPPRQSAPAKRRKSPAPVAAPQADAATAAPKAATSANTAPGSGGNLIAFDPAAKLPASQASQTLQANLARQKPEHAGSVTPFTAARPAKKAPPHEAAVQAVPQQQAMAVGQTHGVQAAPSSARHAGALSATAMTKGGRNDGGAGKTGSVKTGGSSGGKNAGAGGASGAQGRTAARPGQANTAKAGKASAPAGTLNTPMMMKRPIMDPAKSKPSNDNAAPAKPAVKPAGPAATVNDPLTATRVQGDSARKGTYYLEGTAEFKRAQGSSKFVVLPKSQADNLGFKPAGTPRADRVPTIQPLTRNGKQIESSGAGRDTPHNIMARVTPKKTEASAQAAYGKTIGADAMQAQGYKALLTAGEVGILRPGNVSTGGVDAITAVVVDGKAKIFLNDFTGPQTGKSAKPQHKQWVAEMRKATHEDRLNFGDKAMDKAVADAVRSGEVYVRVVRVENGPGGQKVVVLEPKKVDTP